MKFYFLEFCLDWLICLQNDLKRSGLHCDCLCIKIYDSFIIRPFFFNYLVYGSADPIFQDFFYKFSVAGPKPG